MPGCAGISAERAVAAEEARALSEALGDFR